MKPLEPFRDNATMRMSDEQVIETCKRYGRGWSGDAADLIEWQAGRIAELEKLLGLAGRKKRK